MGTPASHHIRSVLIVTLAAVAVGGITSAQAQVEEATLLEEVAGRVEAAARVCLQGNPRLSSIRVQYLVGTSEQTSGNAEVTRRDCLAASEADLKDAGLVCCGVLHTLDGKAATSQSHTDVAVVVGQRLIGDVCKMLPTRVALIVGHELGHLMLGHLDNRLRALDDIPLMGELRRNQEYEADEWGLNYALKAGYADASAQVEQLWQRMEIVFGADAQLEPWERNHPKPHERIANLQIDDARKRRWQYLGAYDAGVMYLTMSQWESAQACFQDVHEVFPESAEVLTNLGYAKMMQYYAGLPPAERTRIGGEVCCATFVTARPLIRGGTDIDKQPLEEAIALFEQVLESDGRFLPALCNLGAANIMYPEAPVEMLQEAARLLTDAERIAQENGDQRTRTQAVANRALALTRLDGGQAYQLLADATNSVRGRENDVLPLHLNFSRILTDSDVEQDLRLAERLLTRYLQHTVEQSAYCGEAKALWRKVRKRLGEAASDADVPAPDRAHWAKVAQLTLEDGGLIYLQQAKEQARARLRPYQVYELPLLPLQSATILDVPEQGTRLRIINGTVQMIELYSAQAPQIELKALGERQVEILSATRPIRIGDHLDADLSNILGIEATIIQIQGRDFWFYHQLGLAIHSSQGTINSIAIL